MAYPHQHHLPCVCDGPAGHGAWVNVRTGASNDFFWVRNVAGRNTFSPNNQWLLTAVLERN
jgi:hypothetical protein